MRRRSYLKALAALPVATRVVIEPRTASVGQPLVDLRDRRAKNHQELVVLMTPAMPDRGYAGFDIHQRADQAERLAERLAIDGRSETFIEWQHDHDEYWQQYRDEFYVGRIEPRSFVAATLGPAPFLPESLVRMADAWVEMTTDTAGEVRFIEFDPFEDVTYFRQQGSVEFA